MKKIFLLFLFPACVFSQVTTENLPQSYTIDTLIHEVKRKQTLYSISKIYDVSIQDLKTFNPQIKGNKLSRKMQLNIPQKRKLISIIDESIVLIEKNKNELINKSNQTINLKDSVFKKKSLKLGLMAPFKIDQFEMDSVEVNKRLLKDLNLTTISLDFYSGAILAIKETVGLGLDIELNVFDTNNDQFRIEKILMENDFESYDFIIGPFIPRNISQISNGIADSKTTIVSPLTTNEVEIKKNIVQSISQKEVQKKAMFSYIDYLVLDEPDPCVMIIYDEKSIETKNKILDRYSYAELIKVNDTQSFVDPEITDSLLVSSKKNFVFLESQNLNIITSVSSLLNSQVNEERDIKLMTTFRSDIYENENISFEHLGKLNFTYPSYYKPIYNQNLTDFNQDYILEFGKLPNKTAIRAYDLTLDLLLRSAVFRKIEKSIKIGQTEYLQNKFDYQIENEMLVNQAVYMIRHEKLEIIEFDFSDL